MQKDSLSPLHQLTDSDQDTLAAQQRAMAGVMERFLAGNAAQWAVRDLPYFGRSVLAHPDRDLVERAAEERWRAGGIDVSPYHERALLSHLTALCYADAPQGRLALCHDVILFAFVCDDQIDTLPEAEEVRVRRLHRECVAAIRRERQGGFTEALARRLADVAERLCDHHRVPPDWYARFSRSIVEFLDHAMSARSRWRHRRTPQPPEVYLHDRYYDVAVSATLDLVEFTSGQFLDERRARGDELWALRCLCSFNVALVNDLVSYAKEVRVGSGNNMLVALERHRGVSFEVARACVVHLARHAAEEFERRAARVEGAEALVRGMRAWMMNSLAWHLRSGRYV